MRKKSHVSLALQISRKMNGSEKEVIKHPYVFCFGSILPDCVPSFLTTPHRKDVTFAKVQEKMRSFVSKYNTKSGCNYRRSIQLGQIAHYIADYFTFPHNTNYEGSLAEHCHYENDLKHELKRYIYSGEAMEQNCDLVCYNNCKDLTDYIERMHKEYVRRKSDVYNDARYIVKVCMVVVASIMEMSRIQYAI